ncbi:hypothetical protein [Yersinia proxima]|uniref:hypothetical protein n=1 Tax=Yersinia proxima TaxID=2890316 RepID=UPI001D115212|nr:hypothetical protein [Yersinia proxima]
MINVQFSDKSKTKIVSYFAGPQDPEAHDFLGEVETNDPVWKEFYYLMPESFRVELPAPE